MADMADMADWRMTFMEMRAIDEASSPAENRGRAGGGSGIYPCSLGCSASSGGRQRSTRKAMCR